MAARELTEAPPPSPCINVCVLDERSTCTGCGRTIDEIANWSRMSAVEQWAVIARLEAAQPGTPTRGRPG